MNVFVFYCNIICTRPGLRCCWFHYTKGSNYASCKLAKLFSQSLLNKSTYIVEMKEKQYENVCTCTYSTC